MNDISQNKEQSEGPKRSSMIKLFQKAVQPFRRQPQQDFDFSNMDDFQYDVEGEFDVYTMESALPDIDWETIEAHLQATKENEMKRRNDREEIRRRLAMGGEEEEEDKKAPLQTRLQTGMNLQICFMNETASDCESQCSDTESTQDHHIDHPKGKGLAKGLSCPDFQTRQVQLQAEARLALGQAKDMARMQMEVDRQHKRCSLVTEIIRDAYNKMGLTFPDNKRRMNRQLLTDMNVAQLQVIVNHLHSQIESLNEELVQHLLARDDFHMEQDSRLVDIEDLTNHLNAKQRSNSTTSSTNKISPSSSSISTPSSSSPLQSSSSPLPPQQLLRNSLSVGSSK